ncbi:MAG: Ldh family oxidoreductase, partial [Synergistaceae bacterium]|nr:Ldh family oxidoreductase [Synergistaceae bacterium]
MTILAAYGDVVKTVKALLGKWGFSGHDIDVIADVLVSADMAGIDSHGIQRLSMYENIIASGIVQVKNRPSAERETPVTAVVDGNRAMGQTTACFSVGLAIQKAEKNGIGAVAVKNSNHFGIAGWYAKRASGRGFMGLVMTNSRAVMPATFGAVPLIGSNPVAFAFPNRPHDFLYDASSTVVSFGKIEVKAREGNALPAHWGLNERGEPTVNPAEVLENFPNRKIAGIFPLGGPGEENGGHKGYGQGLIVEILTGILSGGLMSDGISEGKRDGASHFFLVMNPEAFGDLGEMQKRLNAYFEKLRTSNLLDPERKIYIHGEKEIEKERRCR